MSSCNQNGNASRTCGSNQGTSTLSGAWCGLHLACSCFEWCRHAWVPLRSREAVCRLVADLFIGHIAVRRIHSTDAEQEIVSQSLRSSILFSERLALQSSLVSMMFSGLPAVDGGKGRSIASQCLRHLQVGSGSVPLRPSTTITRRCGSFHGPQSVRWWTPIATLLCLIYICTSTQP